MKKKNPSSWIQDTNWHDWEWHTDYYHPAVIYPIVEVDTTVPPEGLCLKVANVEVEVVDTTCAVVSWDDFPNYTGITVQYGSANVPPNYWTSIELADSTFCRICGFTTAGRYGVRVKAYCEKGETEWSDPVYFYAMGQSEPTSAEPTLLSSSTFLSPNPAHRSMVVSSSFAMKNIDIYNAQGVLVLTVHPDGHRQEVSLEGLPVGTYLVSIATYGGTTHKKLEVR
ncbi:MAG: T9SS type A sorting domain-containing protein [Bacteroidales bacterium]|nr:T9SS type A sorting domain-containing protein [Bacteroidales bacterium]